jgi:hypothetical protein
MRTRTRARFGVLGIVSQSKSGAVETKANRMCQKELANRSSRALTRPD